MLESRLATITREARKTSFIDKVGLASHFSLSPKFFPFFLSPFLLTSTQNQRKSQQSIYNLIFIHLQFHSSQSYSVLPSPTTYPPPSTFEPSTKRFQIKSSILPGSSFSGKSSTTLMVSNLTREPRERERTTFSPEPKASYFSFPHHPSVLKLPFSLLSLFPPLLIPSSSPEPTSRHFSSTPTKNFNSDSSRPSSPPSPSSWLCSSLTQPNDSSSTFIHLHSPSNKINSIVHHLLLRFKAPVTRKEDVLEHSRSSERKIRSRLLLFAAKTEESFSLMESFLGLKWA